MQLLKRKKETPVIHQPHMKNRNRYCLREIMFVKPVTKAADTSERPGTYLWNVTHNKDKQQTTFMMNL